MEELLTVALSNWLDAPTFRSETGKLKRAARDRRRVGFSLFYLIGAVDANVLRFLEAIFAKKVGFFL